MLDNYNNSDSFCPYYNQGLLIDSNSMGQTRIAMCCFQARSEAVSEVRLDHPYLESIRTQSVHTLPVQCAPSCRDSDYFLNERLRAREHECWDSSEIGRAHV